MPRPPSGLKQSGTALWKAAIAEYGAHMDRPSVKLLAEACRALDTVRDLERQLRADGLMTEGSQGQPRLHPAIAELRQARLGVDQLVRSALPRGASIGSVHPSDFAAGERSVRGPVVIDDQIGPDGSPL